MFPRSKQIILITSILSIMYVIIYFLMPKHHAVKKINTKTKDLSLLQKDELFCHNINVVNDSLPDISDNSPNELKRNIFFLETTCNSFNAGKLFIKPRQACSVESAARMNPDMDIYLLFASPGNMKDDNSESDRMLRTLTSYPNIKLMRMNISKFIKGTPIENLWLTKKIKTSLFPIVHTSDALRLLTLWKYGGIYLDLDVVVVKNLSKLPENFAGAETPYSVANGVMGFSRYGKGFQYIDQFLNDFAVNFDGTKWGENGPLLIRRNLLKRCPFFDNELLVRFGKCEEFVILPSSAFYLIYAPWNWFFLKTITQLALKTIEECSFLVHLWNNVSYKIKIHKKDVETLYLSLALKYCPLVVQQVDEYF